MIDPANVPPVGPDEQLARYVFFRGHVRQDNTVKPDAFLPPPDLEMSVTRHLSATETELWDVGEAVATDSQRTLQGRADIGVAVCLAHALAVDPAPLPSNSNHAHVLNWPADKPSQKIIAQQIASSATYIAKP